MVSQKRHWTQSGESALQRVSPPFVPGGCGPLTPQSLSLCRQDHGSELLGGTSGGYIFASSAYPRRPGDRARLLSPQLTADAGQPLCFRFSLYLFGPGVGTLRVRLLAGESERELWRLSGQAGKDWYQGLVPISSEGAFQVSRPPNEQQTAAAYYIPRPHMGGGGWMPPPGRFCALYATFLKLEIGFVL